MRKAARGYIEAEDAGDFEQNGGCDPHPSFACHYLVNCFTILVEASVAQVTQVDDQDIGVEQNHGRFLK